MSNATGTAVIDFGSHPGANEATVLVTGQSSILNTSKAEAWVMSGEATGDHTVSDHRYLPLLAAFTCGAPSAGTGFTIYGNSLHKLTGTFTLKWVWSD